RHLQIKPPIRRTRSVRSAGGSVRLSKQGRTQVPDRQREVHIIKDVASRHRERQRIAPVRCAGIHSTRAPTPSISRATSATRSAAKGPTAGSVRPSRCSFFFPAKSKRFAQSHIQRKSCRPCEIVDRNQRLASRRGRVEAPKFRLH